MNQHNCLPETSAASTLIRLAPWCSGLTCHPVKVEIGGSNPLGVASQTNDRTRLQRRVSCLLAKFVRMRHRLSDATASRLVLAIILNQPPRLPHSRSVRHPGSMRGARSELACWPGHTSRSRRSRLTNLRVLPTPLRVPAYKVHLDVGAQLCQPLSQALSPHDTQLWRRIPEERHMGHGVSLHDFGQFLRQVHSR